MRIKKVIAGATAAAAALAGGVALAAPAQAKGLQPKTITDTAVALSGGGAFDNRSTDFDIAVQALIATGLADVLDGTDKFTVVLPTDGAFIRVAKELGFNPKSEEEAFNNIAGALTVPGVANVLLYHVVAGDFRYNELRQMDGVMTVFGPEFDANRFSITDERDRNSFVLLRNLPASNGKINVITKVILPENPLPATP